MKLKPVGRMVGRLVAEVAVDGEAKSEGWTDEDTADARRMAANFMRLETRLVGELFLGSLEETLSTGIVVHCQRKDATGELIK